VVTSMIRLRFDDCTACNEGCHWCGWQQFCSSFYIKIQWRHR